MIVELVSRLSPRLAANYLINRAYYQDAKRLYQAATGTQYRPGITNTGSGDKSVQVAGTRLRQLARHLEENHDIVVGLFDDLVNNIVGTGVKVSPMVRTLAGELATDANKQIGELWDEWAQSPETTGELGLESLERLVARTYLRDGELFIQHVTSNRFNYQGDVPYVLDLLEPDFVPFDYDDRSKNVLHGVQCNQWGAPTGYFVYKIHPGAPDAAWTDFKQTKVVRASNISHLKFSRRIKQRRGVPVVHAVINRLRDLYDYEESERIAAKIAADMTFFIERTSEFNGEVNVNSAKNRTFKMQAGAGFELLPGEKVSTIKSERPNPKLIDFRSAMIRAVASGVGGRYSSVARDFNGTYSAQRQELVEGVTGYRAHFVYLVRKFYRPMYARFIEQAFFSGALRGMQPDIDLSSIYRADFRPPSIPWIDPQKEAKAWQILVDANLESRAEVIRARGRDPEKVREEIEQERDLVPEASSTDIETVLEDTLEDETDDSQEVA